MCAKFDLLMKKVEESVGKVRIGGNLVNYIF